ncbi:MAG: ExbD/TolR family protein [Bryobacteraceae bacterium]
MASAPVPEGGRGTGKKKSLDAVINVVPFIDLLSCCLAFLLITAVWTQVSKLQVAQAGNATPPAEPPNLLQITLQITGKGYTLTIGQGGSTIDIPRKGTDYDLQALGDRLKAIKQQKQDQRAISVAAEDSVQFNDLVQTIDTCIRIGLDGVTVQAAT